MAYILIFITDVHQLYQVASGWRSIKHDPSTSNVILPDLKAEATRSYWPMACSHFHIWWGLARSCFIWEVRDYDFIIAVAVSLRS